MKCFDPKYNDLPKVELHCHLEGAIRTATIIDIARQHGLSLPAYDVSGLDPHVKVYEQLRDLEAVLEAFSIARNSIVSPSVVERMAEEGFLAGVALGDEYGGGLLVAVTEKRTRAEIDAYAAAFEKVVR